MKLWGSLLAVVILLASTACARDVSGSPVAGATVTEPAQEISASPAEPTGVTECTDCDRDAIEAATKNPLVARTKRVGTPPACEAILPLPAISQVVGVNAYPRDTEFRNQCDAVYENTDLSRTGQVRTEFSSPPISGPIAISEFEGNTLLEKEVSDRTCEYGLAINDALKRHEHGSWLLVQVFSENGNTPPCELARQLVEIAFENLPDA
jgi:hypothetical protein